MPKEFNQRPCFVQKTSVWFSYISPKSGPFLGLFWVGRFTVALFEQNRIFLRTNKLTKSTDKADIKLTKSTLFVCLFFGINPKKLYSASCWEGSKPPGNDHTRAEAQTTCIPKTGTNHVRVNLWLTLYQLTGWLASLDLRQLYTRRILSHRTAASTHSLFDVLVLTGGGVKPWTIWWRIPMETRTARQLSNTKHTRIHTCAHTQKD